MTFTNNILRILALACVFISTLAILWFDSTHNLWVFSECVAVQRVLDVSFSFRNIGDWLFYIIPILWGNIGVYAKFKGLGIWYDALYAFCCLWGMTMSVLVAIWQIPWDGDVRTFENEIFADELLVQMIFFTVFALTPTILVICGVKAYKHLKRIREE